MPIKEDLLPGEPNAEFRRMAEDPYAWDLSADLLGGTNAMIEAGARWLPKFPHEEQELWDFRLRQNVLYPGLETALTAAVSRPFSRPIVFEGAELPEGLQHLLLNADKKGSSLTEFFRRMLFRAVQNGLAHVFVKMPVNEAQTLLDEEVSDPRVSLQLISAPNLLDVTPSSNAGVFTVGYMKTLFHKSIKGQRVRHVMELSDEGEWVLYQASNESNEVTPDAGAVHPGRQDDPDEIGERVQSRTFDRGFKEIGNGRHDFTDGLPLRTIYTNRLGPYLAKSPFQAVAELNLTHWRSNADQRNILSFARAGMLFGEGLDEKDKKKRASYGPSRRMFGPKGSDLRWVEMNGTGAQIGRQDLKDLEETMDQVGARLNLDRSGRVTATETAIDEAKSQSNQQTWGVASEITINDVLRLAAEAMGVTLPGELYAAVNLESSVLRLGAETEMTVLSTMGAEGFIDKRTLLLEAQRRGMLAPDRDIDQILSRVEEEEQLQAERTMEMERSMNTNDAEGDDGNPQGGEE